MNPRLQIYCENLIGNFPQISEDRKVILNEIAIYAADKLINKNVLHLIFVCTHNSRRSQFAQVWAQLAAKYYDLKKVKSYSAGTEVTAFNNNAINALKRAGFEVQSRSKIDNPAFDLEFEKSQEKISCFSKGFEDPSLPKDHFAAIMTCSTADKECPIVPGAEKRFVCSYQDPKRFDGQSLQDEMYDKSCREIARDMFYVFFMTGKKILNSKADSYRL